MTTARCLVLLVVFYFSAIATAVGQDVFFVSKKSDPNYGNLLIADFDENQLGLLKKNGGSKCLKIYPKENWKNTDGLLPAMIGDYFFENNKMIFKPLFPFREKGIYLIDFNFDSSFQKEIIIPDYLTTEAASVEEIFPTAQYWPSNQLKIYIYFSRPMGMGNIYEQIILFDENGSIVEKPFLEIEPALWDKTQQRLTLWFDPGRIKRDLIPNRKMGPPLVEGQSYTLFISKNCKDAMGNGLQSDFKKEFKTTAVDRQMPDPAMWEIGYPEPDTQQPLIIHFPEPMDKGAVESLIGIADGNNEFISGKIKTENHEMNWHFIPDEKWKAGSYFISINERLEDLAGNNLVRLFDSEIKIDEKTKTPVTRIEFILP